MSNIVVIVANAVWNGDSDSPLREGTGALRDVWIRQILFERIILRSVAFRYSLNFADPISMLELVNYQKSFGSREILNIPYLKLQKGVHWLKGENGVGKSTLLKSIAGISGFKGSILLNGSLDSVKRPVQYRRVVNYAGAEPVFPDFLTGNDLVQLFSETKSGDKATTEKLLDELRIDYLPDTVATYSSGMLKKLSLVLAFMGNPELIVLDEPLITLDAESAETVLEWIGENQSSSFLITSHQEIPESVCKSHLFIERKTVHT